MAAQDGADQGQAQATGRQLAVVGNRPPRSAPTRVPAADAGFLAQLMACRADMPAFRRHRRAEPAAATALYRARPAVAGQRPTVRIA